MQLSAHVSNPSLTLLLATALKLVGSPSWCLLVSVPWSVMGSLYGMRRRVLRLPRKSFVTQPDLNTWSPYECSHMCISKITHEHVHIQKREWTIPFETSSHVF